MTTEDTLEKPTSIDIESELQHLDFESFEIEDIRDVGLNAHAAAIPPWGCLCSSCSSCCS